MTNKERARIVNEYLGLWVNYFDYDFSNFTSEAKALILNAARLAMYMGDSKIGTEYLLLAGTKLKKTEIFYELTLSGITAERVAKIIKKVKTKAEYPTFLKFEDFTTNAKMVLAYAQLLDDGLITTSDILESLRYYNESTACDIIRDILDDIEDEEEEE